MAEILGDQQRAHIVRSEERVYWLTTELESVQRELQNVQNLNTVTAGEKDFLLREIAEQLIRAREEAEVLRKKLKRETGASRCLAGLSQYKTVLPAVVVLVSTIFLSLCL